MTINALVSREKNISPLSLQELPDDVLANIFQFALYDEDAVQYERLTEDVSDPRNMARTYRNLSLVSRGFQNFLQRKLKVLYLPLMENQQVMVPRQIVRKILADNAFAQNRNGRLYRAHRDWAIRSCIRGEHLGDLEICLRRQNRQSREEITHLDFSDHLSRCIAQEGFDPIFVKILSLLPSLEEISGKDYLIESFVDNLKTCRNLSDKETRREIESFFEKEIFQNEWRDLPPILSDQALGDLYNSVKKGHVRLNFDEENRFVNITFSKDYFSLCSSQFLRLENVDTIEQIQNLARFLPATQAVYLVNKNVTPQQVHEILEKFADLRLLVLYRPRSLRANNLPEVMKKYPQLEMIVLEYSQITRLQVKPEGIEVLET